MSEQKKQKKTRVARLSSAYECDYEKGTVKFKNQKCPRCGNIMAFHKAPVKRHTCGACSYTDFVSG